MEKTVLHSQHSKYFTFLQRLVVFLLFFIIFSLVHILVKQRRKNAINLMSLIFARKLFRLLHTLFLLACCRKKCRASAVYTMFVSQVLGANFMCSIFFSFGCSQFGSSKNGNYLHIFLHEQNSCNYLHSTRYVHDRVWHAFVQTFSNI